MMGSKKCEVILAYGNYRVGDVIYPPGLLRDQLLACGYIRVCEPDEPAVKAVVAPVQEKRKRRRGGA